MHLPRAPFLPSPAPDSDRRSQIGVKRSAECWFRELVEKYGVDVEVVDKFTERRQRHEHALGDRRLERITSVRWCRQIS